MRTSIASLAFAAAAGLCGHAAAAEGTVVWYDSTCRYFVMQLPASGEGFDFGLYEWKGGPEPKEGAVIAGDILGGPELNVTDAGSGQSMAVVHWGDAKNKDLLVRYSPDWCKSKRKRR
jgi:hypothetical protein